MKNPQKKVVYEPYNNVSHLYLNGYTMASLWFDTDEFETFELDLRDPYTESELYSIYEDLEYAKEQYLN